MRSDKPTATFQFSTDSVEEQFRFDFWADALSKAVVPLVTTSSEKDGFRCRVSVSPLASLRVIHTEGSRQEFARTAKCLGADQDHSFYLMGSHREAWNLNWRGTAVHLRTGDLVLTDSRYIHSGSYPTGLHVVNIAMPPEWLLAWLRQPERMVGRRIDREVGWGRTLSTFVSRLTEEFLGALPVTADSISQHIGSLLSLVEAEQFSDVATPCANAKAIGEGICSLIRERANEPGLTAHHIASALDIAEKTLHRRLAAAGLTFAEVLLRHRVDAAKAMLEGRRFDRLTTGEIGHRAGFADPSYFVRTAVRHLGSTPSRYREVHRNARLDG